MCRKFGAQLNLLFAMRKLFLLTLLISGFGLSSVLYAQAYTLSVEEHAVDMIPGETTYRVYVDLVNETDFLSSVYGGCLLYTSPSPRDR